jgi:hypothetical protein
VPVPLDLVGQQFGYLKVTAKSDTKNVTGRVQWVCECVCGNTHVVSTMHLRNGHTTNCGCKKIRDLTGQRFGRLTVIEKTDKRCSGAVMWKVRCDCGEEKTVARGPLLKGQTVSCGCYLREAVTTHGLSKTAGYRRYYSRLREERVKQRTPIWYEQEKEAIREFYSNCPVGYEVDHIVPISASKASGLHTLANLQYVLAEVNRRKYNKFEPQVYTSK